MPEKMETLMGRWLHRLKIPVSFSYLRFKLLSHTDYPSLLSVTDTLDALRIDHTVFIVDKEKLHEIPVPFLAYVDANGGDFILVTNVTSLLQRQPGFLKQWNGLTVIAEKPDVFNDPENTKWRSKEKKNKQITVSAITLILAFAVFATLLQLNWLITGVMLTSIAGLIVSALIVQHDLGINNTITQQLCGTGKNMDCNAVLHSKNSKVFSWLNWADMGIVWFCSLFLIVLISLFSSVTAPLIALLILLTIATMPFTLFSLYYQRFVIKKWCPLCLLVIAILWAQALIVLPETGNIVLRSISLNSIGLIALIFTIVSVEWMLLLKPLFHKVRETTDKYFSLLRFKNDPDIFEAVLNQQKKTDTTPFENDLQLGNSDAPDQVMVVCNPYCKPCAETHKILHNLVEKNNIGLTIRFTVKSYSSQSTEVKTVQYLLHLIHEKTNQASKKAKTDFIKRVLSDWFEWMDMERFKTKYAVRVPEKSGNLVYDCWRWSRENEINTVPTIFLNGRMLPRGYKAGDLLFFIKETQDKTLRRARI